jgi:hypothetical protein
MPRCVNLPVYNPASDLKLVKFRNGKTNLHPLALYGIKGPAGRVGLRIGDIVTHVNGELVSTPDEFAEALQLATHKSSFWLLVNADEGTAYHLQKRAITMQREKVKFS